MKKFLPLFILLSLFSLFSYQGYASHMMGSDITYRCIGGGKYEVTVVVYRDCNGIPLSSSPLEITCSAGSMNVNLPEVLVRDITGIDARCTTQSRCSGSYQYGIEEHTFQGIVDLSSLNCCEVKLAWQQSARNGAITTGAAGYNFYTQATLNKCVTPCNSSPKFTSAPAALICVGQDFVFNNGAVDTIDQGDSLSYGFAEPLQYSGSTIPYSGSWTYQRPISFLGFPNAGLSLPAGFHLDSITGDIAFRPTVQNQVTVMVLEVTEWRTINGTPTVVGKTRRDMQIIVVPCPNNNIPTITGSSSKQACAGQQVCINVGTQDPNSGDTTRISWNKGIPRATFSNNNGTVKRASGSVCWTPAESDVSNIPYTFTITAKDDACPLAGQSIRAFSIFVRDSPKAIRDITKLICGRVAVNYTPLKNNYVGLSGQWLAKDSNNVTVFISAKQQDTLQLQPGLNRLFLTLSTATPCVNTMVDTIIIDPFVQVKLPKDTFICAGNPMTLKTVTTYGQPTYHYHWSTSTTDTGTQVTVNPGVDSSFWVNVTDAQGCKNSDTIKVAWKPLPLLQLAADTRICFDQDVTLDAGNDSTTLSFLWSTGDTTRTLTVKDSNRYTVTIKDSIGCKNSDTFNLFVNTVPVNGGPDQYICNKDTVHFSGTGADSYQWYLSPNFGTPAASTATYNYTVTANGEVRVKGTRTYAGLTCTNTDTVQVYMNQLPQISFGTVSPRCVNALPFNLSSEALSYPTLTSGTWTALSPLNSGAVNSGLFYPDQAGAGTWSIKYNVTDANGCKNTGITNITVNSLPPVSTIDPSYCGNEGKKNLASLIVNPTSSLPGTKDWSTPDFQAQNALQQAGFGNYTFDLSLVPQNKTYPLILKFTYSLTGCTGYDTVYLTSRPVPVVEAGYVGEICQNDSSFELNAKSGSYPQGGYWTAQTPGSGFYNDSFFNPGTVADPNYGSYWMSYTYDIPNNNCPVTDSVEVIVKPQPTVDALAVSGVCINVGTVDLTPYGTPSGGTWSGDGGVTGGGSFDAATAGQGLYHFTYDYTDGGTGCKSSDTTSVYVQSLPTLAVTIPKPACAGQPYPLSASYSGAGGIQWSTQGDGTFDNSTGSSPVYTPGTQDNAINKFIVDVQTTGNGLCPAATYTAGINIYPIPQISIVATPLKGCQPLPVDFVAVTNMPTGATYQWNFGDAASADNTSDKQKPGHEYLEEGNYTVSLKITSKDTCENTAEPVSIEVWPTPSALFKMSKRLTTVAATGIEFYDKTTIDAPGLISSYKWTFGDPKNSSSILQNPTFEYPTDTGKYFITLKVESDKGCKSEYTDTLLINPDITVFIPNAFTPNLYGTPKNNRFWVTAEGFLTFNIGIFNRWGERVYYSENINEGWDGYFKGEPAQQDVYAYVVNITSFSGKPYKYSGTVTLLR